MIQELSRDAVVDILYGSMVFGAGGGGALEEGLALLDRALAAGKRFRMVTLDAVPDDAMLCVPYLLGAVSDLPTGEDTLFEDAHPLVRAYECLEKHVRGSVYGALPCELGGSNTAVPFFVAAMSDTVVVDADPAGRAVPEITHSAFALAGLPPAPIFAANALGETMVLEHIKTDQRAEDLVRMLARASGNDISAIDHVQTARRMLPHLIPGTLSKAARVGKLLRDETQAPLTLPEKIAEATDGLVFFTGRVAESGYRVEEGFTVGRFAIEGSGAHFGQMLSIDVKNENMAGWIDGEPVVTVPEIITVLDTRSGKVICNPDVQVSQEVTVLVLPAPSVFLTQQGLATFGPSYLGLASAFTPVCAASSLTDSPALSIT